MIQPHTKNLHSLLSLWGIQFWHTPILSHKQKFCTVHLMFFLRCIIDINNVEDQLDATIIIYWYSNQLNMFRAIFCPSSGAQDCFTDCGIMHCKDGHIIVWSQVGSIYTAHLVLYIICPSLQCIIPQAAKHSLALLMMGKKLPETYWADWNISKLLLLLLVGLLHYLQN